MNKILFLSYLTRFFEKRLTESVSSLLVTLTELENLELELNSSFNLKTPLYKSKKTIFGYFSGQSIALEKKITKQLLVIKQLNSFLSWIVMSNRSFFFKENPEKEMIEYTLKVSNLNKLGLILLKICSDLEKNIQIEDENSNNFRQKNLRKLILLLYVNLPLFEMNLEEQLKEYKKKVRTFTQLSEKKIKVEGISENFPEKSIFTTEAVLPTNARNLKNQLKGSITQVSSERTGLIPRSIGRTVNRFLKELGPNGEKTLLQEFNISRYQLWVSIRCFFLIIFVPLLIGKTITITCLKPLVTVYWNNTQTELFVHSFQEEKAFKELEQYESELYFDTLLLDAPNLPEKARENNRALVDLRVNSINSEKIMENFLSISSKEKIEEIASKVNQESIDSIINLLNDSITIFSFLILIKYLQAEIIITKTFFSEILYSLSDTTKSFLIILSTDLLVGFHSPKAWEIFIELILERFGLPNNDDFILLCVATVPVLLDTAFKYWIFRYLNKLSPSTVVTYHNMIE